MVKVKLTPNPSGRRGVALTVEHMGTETITYFNVPPRSIDHVDVAYLQKRGLWNVTTKKQLKYIQDEFKKYMQNLSDNNLLDKQIKLLQAVKFLLECPQDIIDSLDPDDKTKLCAKIEESLGKVGGKCV